MRLALCLLVLGTLAIAGCAPSAGWDPRAAASLEQRATTMLAQLDAGDFTAMIADADSNVVIMDFDANNVPMRVDGIAAAREFMSGMAEMAKTQNLKFTSTLVRNDGWAMGGMGYCVTEYDQTIQMGAETMGPFKYRGTLIARREGERWLMTHWHGSFREMPAMPAAETAVAR